MMNHAEAKALLINAGYNPVLGVAAQERLLQACKSGPAAEVEAWITLGIPVNIHDHPLGETPLIRATEGGHADIIGLLLAAGADPNATDSSGDHALLTAVNWAKPQLIDVLIAAGCQINLLSKKKWSPLSAAIHKDQPAVALKLLAAGADPNLGIALAAPPLAFLKPAHQAVFDALVAAGLDVNVAVPATGTTWLMSFVLNKNPVANWLIAAGADQDRANIYGWSARDCAAWVQGSDPRADWRLLKDIEQKKPLTSWLASPNLPVHAQKWNGDTPLTLLAGQENWAAVRQLIQRGADVNRANQDGWTALTWAAHHKQATEVAWLIAQGARATEVVGRSRALLRAARAGATDVVELLLAAGAETKSKDDHGQTPLFLACAGGHIGVVRALLAAGADIEARADTGATPLLIAATFGEAEITKLLLDAGADVHARTHDNETAIYKAANHYDKKPGHAACVALLLQAGTDIDVPNRFGLMPHYDIQRRPPLYDVLKAHMAAHPGSFTALKDAIERQDVVAVEQSLAAGAPLTLAGQSTALQLAAKTGNTSIIQMLLRKGADPNQPGWRGFTALMGASEVGALNVVQVLLAAGADPNAQSEHSYTALCRAAEKDHIDVMEVLVQAGALVQPTPAGPTPLAQAVKGKASKAAKWLLMRGADPTTKLPGGISVLEQVTKDKATALIKLLKDPTTISLPAPVKTKAPKPKPLPITGNSLLQAIYAGDEALVTSMLSKGADLRTRTPAGDTALVLACRVGSLAMMQGLVAAGVSIHDPGAAGDTPWAVSILQQNDALKDWVQAQGGTLNIEKQLNLAGRILDFQSHIQNGDLQAIEDMLNTHQIDLHRIDAHRTPLSLAVGHKNPTVVKLLLDKGARIDWSPPDLLHTAIFTKNARIVKLLLAAGADPNRPSPSGLRPLQAAGRAKAIVTALVQAGAV